MNQQLDFILGPSLVKAASPFSVGLATTRALSRNAKTITGVSLIRKIERHVKHVD
jgi:hypothetical protein